MGGALGLLHKIVTVTLAKYFTKSLIFVFKVHLEIIVKFINQSVVSPNLLPMTITSLLI